MATISTAARAAIPGPRTLPVAGWRLNMLPLLRDPINYMQRLHRTYGDVVSLDPGGDEFVFVFSPELNHQVLSDQMLFFNGDLQSNSAGMRIPPDSGAAHLFSGITTMNAGKHTQQRRLLMPAFHKKRIAGLHAEMIALTERRLSQWHVGGQVDLLREMKGLTLSVAVQTILGLDPAREGEQLRGLMQEWLRLALSPLVFLAPVNLPGTPFHRMLALSDRLEGEIRGMIARRRAAGGDRGDALSMLIQAHDEDGTRLTDNDLIGQTTALFIAGHETTASALTWTLFLLDQHPQVLRDLLDELDGKLHGASPTLEQLNDLPLLDRVINESLRLLPPGLWFLRVNTAPTQLGPYEVPEGRRILWTPVVAHRNPDLYPEPARFRPARWENLDPGPYAYLPFGGGPRRCLGATFALTEMKIVLPMILQRFRVAVPSRARVDLAPAPLAAPKGGLPVRLLPHGARVHKQPAQGNIRAVVDLA